MSLAKRLSTVAIEVSLLGHLFIFSNNFVVADKLVPREARAEGPSVARLINLSGRWPRSGAKPCEFEPNIYLYICLYISVKVSVLLPGNSARTKYE